MGLRDELQADIAEAFDDVDGLANATDPFNGIRETVGEYDPVAGTTPTATVNYSGRGVFGGYSVQEIDGQHIKATDARLIALQNEISQSGSAAPLIPAIDDIIRAWLFVDGAEGVGMATPVPYLVINVGQDPAKATHRIQLRKT